MKWIQVMGTLLVWGAVNQPVAEAAPKRCAICQMALEGRYWTFEGDPKVFCDRCVQTKPKCYGCERPLVGESVEVRGKHLCRECVASRPRCGDCRLPILKKYFQVTGIRDSYCDHCYLYHPHCRFCGRPSQEGGQPPTAAAGPVCADCRSEAVTDPKTIESWIRDIRAWLESDFGLRVELPLRFRVEDEIESGIEKPRFEAYQELGAFIVEGERRSVILVQGLPKSKLIETVAHELAHAWQWEVGVRDQLLEHKEGFAQWVAGKVLQKFGHGDSIVVLRERPDLYGVGFRIFEEIERQQGIPAVLSYAKSAK